MCKAAMEMELMMMPELLGLELPSWTNWSGKSRIHGNNSSEQTKDLKYKHTFKRMKFHIEFIDIVEIDKINVQLMCTYLSI